MDVKSRNGEKFEIFSNCFLKFLANPVETPWSILTVLHQNMRRSVPFEPHLEALMVAVLCTNETIPYFLSFNSPTRPQGPMDPRAGRGTSADIEHLYSPQVVAEN